MSNYASNSTTRKAAAASVTNKAEANQETYKDFNGGAQTVQESNYAGNKVSPSGSYKKETAKVTKSPNYS